MNLTNIVNPFFLSRRLSFLLAISLLAIISSYTLEIFYGYGVCKLCRFQRYIFILVAVMTLSLFFAKKVVFLNFLILSLSTSGFLLSIYHLAIQFDFIADPCSIAPVLSDFESFKLAMIRKSIPCSTMVKLAGFPISGLSSILSILCIALSWFETEKNKKI
jgi:disulfide bond formation protein DsbB